MDAYGKSSIQRDPNILGGDPAFAGTRVHARTLFDYLEGGHTLDQFLDDFPSVRRDQALAVLADMRELLLARTG